MSQYSLSHLSDGTLLRDLAEIVARDRATTAALLAHLAEVDDRKLYLPAGDPSMYAWCVGELRMCEHAAFNRIRAARTARRFPAIFDAVADGRLHLSTVVMLTPYLTEETADDLMAAAAYKSKAEVEHLLAQRFPRPDLPAIVQALSTDPSAGQLAPGRVGAMSPSIFQQLSPGIVEELTVRPADQLAPGRVEFSAPARIEAPAPRPRLTPLAPERFALQVTIGQSTHDKLRYAQELLSHQVPPGDVAEVLDRALDALIRRLEQRKFAATSRPRRGRRPAMAGGRYVPADVRHAVWKRDQGQCTFRSETGHRCPARTRLEFDHVDEVARGGRATIGGIRLQCRAHNQYGAERTFGAEFMKHKRESAQREAVAHAGRVRRAALEGAAALPAEKTTREDIAARSNVPANQHDERDVVPWLRSLGFRADEARRAAEFCETIPDATLEERIKAALSYLVRPRRTASSLGTAA